MSRWGNSKALTQASYGLVQEHPSMNRWAVRAAVHGAVVGGVGVLVGLGLMAAGGVMSDTAEKSGGSTLGVVALVLGFVVVLAGLVAGLTAANLQLAGLVSATDDVLHGRELDEQAAKDAAHARLGTLTAWSGISVAVGALVSMVRGDGERRHRHHDHPVPAGGPGRGRLGRRHHAGPAHHRARGPGCGRRDQAVDRAHPLDVG